MTSKALYELLIRSYARFMYFRQTWKFTISKNTNVNNRKSKHYEELNFSRQKIQKIQLEKTEFKARLEAIIYSFKVLVCFQYK